MNNSELRHPKTLLPSVTKVREDFLWPYITQMKNSLGVAITTIDNVILQRKFKWPGHVQRRKKRNLSKIALQWTPNGKMGRRRPEDTWRRTVEVELKAFPTEILAYERHKWEKGAIKGSK